MFFFVVVSSLVCREVAYFDTRSWTDIRDIFFRHQIDVLLFVVALDSLPWRYAHAFVFRNIYRDLH